MLETGDTVSDFTAPMARGGSYDDVGEFRLSAALESGPVVLAFFPGAFTGGCTTEMCAFRDDIAAFERVGAQVYGVSVDLPPALNVFSQQQSLNFRLLSDSNRDLVETFGVVRDELYGARDVARRTVFVVDDGEIAYHWDRGDRRDVDYEALVSEVADVVASLD